jgi:glycogen debranching enzyme
MARAEVRSEQRFAWHGQSLLVTDIRGDCGDQDALTGYYFRETRFLRGIRLVVNGRPPWLCETAGASPTDLAFTYVHPEMTSFGGGGSGASGDDVGAGADNIPHRALEIRSRCDVGIAGLRIRVDVVNHCTMPVRFTIGWELSADFADIQEALEGKRQQTGQVHTVAADSKLSFSYRHPELPYETHVAAVGECDAGETTWEYSDHGVRTSLALAPQRGARLLLTVAPYDYASPISPRDEEEREAAWSAWNERLTRIDTPGNTVAEAIVRANVRDLASYPLLQGKRDEWLAMQAGVPLYPALFGRDAFTAGWQAAMIDRGEFLDAGLTRLGRLQSSRTDDWRDAQPGRIPYQVRQGPLARLDINPYSAYYADYASPLMFIVSLAQLYAWSGDKALLVKHWDVARRVLDWARDYGDMDGDGYLEYLTRSPKGTKNQGWKDSGNAILYDDGSTVEPPIGTCELQGYWFATQQIFSVLCRIMNRDDDARAYWASASELKTRFNHDWWLEDDSFFALAMDPEKRLVRALSSNVGQCIATGIIDDEHLPRTVDRLFQPDMYSGWMVRTLSSDHVAYNPLEYHLGSIWAVENATIVFGLRRFGFDERALQLTRSMFELAQLYPDFRIPECVGGFARRQRATPGAYPRSNTAQLWNASAFVLLVQTMLGLQPVAPLDLLVFDPALPAWLPEIVLRDLRVGGATATIRFWRDEHGDTHGEVLDKTGTLHLIKQPPPESLRANATDRFTALLDRIVHH